MMFKVFESSDPLSGSGKAMLGPLMLELELKIKRKAYTAYCSRWCVGVGLFGTRYGLRSGGSANPGGRPW